jgi:catechol 2,3-dioxygenase
MAEHGSDTSEGTFMELRFSHIALGAADLSASGSFYREVMGLLPMGHGDEDTTRLGHGLGQHVLELGAGSGVDHFGLEVRGIAVEELASKLDSAGHPVESRTGSFWLQDPDGNRIELHGPIDRSGEQSTDGRLRPQRADHITFGSPRVEEMVEFYVGALGLRVSDRMEEDFVWMRGSAHHHDVAVVRAPDARLDHYSFEICSWDNILAWCDRFAANGVPLTWGPGRHGPGHNLFVFVADPDGRQVELSCDMEQFLDDLVDYGERPRIWTRGPRVANLWGPLPASRVALTASDRSATVEAAS